MAYYIRYRQKSKYAFVIHQEGCTRLKRRNAWVTPWFEAPTSDAAFECARADGRTKDYGCKVCGTSEWTTYTL